MLLAVLHVVSHPDYVKHVLMDNYQNYRKSGAYKRLGMVFGNGLLTSEGDFWLRQRRLAQPAFHRKRLEKLSELMTEATEQMLSGRWAPLAKAGKPVDISDEMMRLTLKIVGLSLFSTDLSNETSKVGRAVNYLREYTDRRAWGILVFPENVPTPRNLRFRRALKTLDEVVYGITQHHRSTGKDSGDLTSMLALARDEETGEQMSARQLRDEVMTMLMSGHDTSTATLSWAWYLLSKHPEAYRRLRTELDEVLSGRPPSFDDLSSLAYTKMVFQETLRLYPPGWLIPRIAKEEDEIAGYSIPKESRVALCPYVTHRDPALWENPEGFDPQRFSPESFDGLPNFAYFPFGGGPRQCIGMNYAMMEGVLILATIAQKYRPDLVPGFNVEPETSLTMRPRGPIPMALHPQ